jgi:lipooligosaccharide transport system permease protein
MTEVQVTLHGILSVWKRYFAVYRKSLVFSLMTTFAEPIMYLLAFGYGLGGLIGHIDVHGTRQTYREFVFSGIVAQTVLFQSFFDASFGSFIRMYYQQVFKAIATTPVTLSEVLWGELIWDASKATFSATVVLLIGTLVGDFSLWGAISSVPICFVAGLAFAGLGLVSSALAQNMDQLSYPQYLLIFPMFLFGGVYFPLDNLPTVLHWVAWLFPLTPFLSLIRTLTLELPLQPLAIPILAAWMIFFVWISRRSMMHRLIK